MDRTKPVVYVSSTFVDLEDHRAALKRSLEKAQYDVECMEKYPAFDQRPLDKCLVDVANADVYVLLIAHRYGFRPDQDNPERKSITRLEYEEAGRHPNKPRLVFTVDPEHPWSPKWIDQGEDANDLEDFRTEVGQKHGTNPFTTPEDLASRVLEALSNWRVEQAPAPGTITASSAYRWPAPWDFGPYMSDKREQFEGREWLFADIAAWRADDRGQRALLIRADFGVGKSAMMAELVARRHDAGVLAWHFCQHDTQETLHPGAFVRQLAGQIAEVLPEYKALIEAEPALQERLDRALTDPGSAFEGALLTPLSRLEPPAGPRLLLIDALDEALELDPESRQRSGTIISLLASRAGRFPAWLRVLATARPNPEVSRPLQYGFDLREIDAESVANRDDLRRYILARVQRDPLAERLRAVGRDSGDFTERLLTQSQGKFLYAGRALRDLANGQIGVDELAALPPGMDSFYLDAFERRFRRAGRDYTQARDLLGVLAEAREPLPPELLAAVLGVGIGVVRAVRQTLPDFLRLSAGRLSFDHFSLAQWLTGEDTDGFSRAGDYAVDSAAARRRLHDWALQEIDAGRAHESPYLLRHLAAALPDETERGHIYERLLLKGFDWWPARLAQGGVEGLLADAEHLHGHPEQPWLMALLRNSAHVLRKYPEQLAAQVLGLVGMGLGKDFLLATLSHDVERWLNTPEGQIQSEGLLLPSSRSMRLSTASDAVLEGGGECLAVLPDGRIASGSEDGTVRLWDPQRPGEPVVFEGHTVKVEVLAVLPDGRVASGSTDHRVRLWDPLRLAEPVVFEGHFGSVNALAVLPDGRIASGSSDHCVRLWDPQHPAEPLVLEGHSNGIEALAVLPDGRIASGSRDGSVRLWDPQRPAEPVVFEGHTGGVGALAVLPDGWIASGSRDGRVRLWDSQRPAEPVVFEGHTEEVVALAVLPDGRVASGSGDGTVRLWDPQRPAEPVVFEGHTGGVGALAVLPDGRIASGSWDGSVRLWDPQRPAEPVVFEGHTGGVGALAVLPDGRIASGSSDRSVRLWDPQRPAEPLVFEGHSGGVYTLAVLPDGRIASGSRDGRVRLWDPQRPAEPLVFEGHSGGVNALAVLPDGRIASGSTDGNVRLWDPQRPAEPLVFEGPFGWVSALAVLPDGRLASGSGDGTVRLWDPADPSRARAFVADAAVTCLAATPTGLIVAGCADGAVHFLREAGAG